jgi:hypothetical protein
LIALDDGLQDGAQYSQNCTRNTMEKSRHI